MQHRNQEIMFVDADGMRSGAMEFMHAPIGLCIGSVSKSNQQYNTHLCISNVSEEKNIYQCKLTQTMILLLKP